MACIFHNWIGCRCTKCGKVNDDRHEWKWRSYPDGLCHQVCIHCAKTKEKTEHHWEPVPGKCEEKCSQCGITREAHHFTGISGVCRERCTSCGKLRDIDHQFEWDGCRGTCTRCGYKTHKWNQAGVSVDKKPIYGCKCTVCGEINRNGVHIWETINQEGTEVTKKCTVCGKTDIFHDWSAASTRKERSMEDELIAMDSLQPVIVPKENDPFLQDSLHDMQAKGIK